MEPSGGGALPLLCFVATLTLVAALAHRCARGQTGGRRALLAAVLLATAAPLLLIELRWARLLGDAGLRFERPVLAPLGAAAAALVALRWLASRPPRRPMPGLLAWASALACSLALLGPSTDAAPADRQLVLLVADRSRSMDLVPDASERVAHELDAAEPSMHRDDRIGLVGFGADAALEVRPRWRHNRSWPPVSVDRGATDLAAGIRRALAEIPDDAAARIVLLTDGVATRGDALAAAADARAAGVPVDAIELAQRPGPDVRVTSLRAPPTLAAGEAFELRVQVQAPAQAELLVSVERDGATLRRERVRVEAGEQTLRLRDRAPGAGTHRYEVSVRALDPALDSIADNNRATAFARVRGASAALVLEGDEGRGEFVAESLRSAGFHVEVGGSSSVPEGVAGMAGYDLIVLSDIPASELSTAQTQALASYTRDLGGGLLLLGGDRSLGAGGYRGTPVEEVSPVRFEPPPDRREARALVLAIDASGSMADLAPGGRRKIALANEAVLRAVGQLGPGDQVGIAHVTTAVRWSAPLGPADDPALRGASGADAGGGGIYADLALDEGYAALQRASADHKHLLLFSDGDDAEQLEGCLERARAALDLGITTSVVALGNGQHVPALRELAQAGGGRFHLIETEHADRLPAVFAEEAGQFGQSSLRDVSFRPTPGTPGPALRGVDLASAPPLGGYAVTRPRPRASVHLRGPEGDPILAAWSVGVGRAAAFMSDLKDRWGQAWTGWPGAARLIGQLGRELARSHEDRRVRLDGDASGGELRLRASAVDAEGKPESLRPMTAQITGPDGLSRSVALAPVGVGTYAASAPAPLTGTYLVTAFDDLTKQPLGSFALWADDDELRAASGHSLLSQVTSLAGGRLRTSTAGIFDERLARRSAPTPLAPALLAATALLLLAGAAARRLGAG